jgi:hypothetical protein
MKRNQMGSKTKNTGFGVGICDIDFFNFHYRQVRNFKILNWSEQDRNFAVKF